METFTFIKDDFNSIFLNNSLISHVKSGNHYLGSVSNFAFHFKIDKYDINTGKKRYGAGSPH